MGLAIWRRPLKQRWKLHGKGRSICSRSHNQKIAALASRVQMFSDLATICSCGPPSRNLRNSHHVSVGIVLRCEYQDCRKAITGLRHIHGLEDEHAALPPLQACRHRHPWEADIQRNDAGALQGMWPVFGVKFFSRSLFEGTVLSHPDCCRSHSYSQRVVDAPLRRRGNGVCVVDGWLAAHACYGTEASESTITSGQLPICEVQVMKLSEVQQAILTSLRNAVEASPSREFIYISEWLGDLPFGLYHWVEINGADCSRTLPDGWQKSDLEILEEAGCIVKRSEWQEPDDTLHQKVTYAIA